MKVYILAQHSIFYDPPIRNLAVYLANMNYNVVAIQQGVIFEKINHRLVKCVNIKSINIFSGSPLVKLMNIGLKYFYFRFFIERKVENVYFIQMHRNISLFSLFDGVNWIPIITDITGKVGVGKFDFLLNKIALLKLRCAQKIVVSDFLRRHALNEILNVDVIKYEVVHNCPALNYLSDIRRYSKKEAREFLKSRGFSSIESDDFLILRAGGAGYFGGIEETIAALKLLPKKVKFVIIGRSNEEFIEKINAQIIQLELQNRVSIKGFVEEDIYQMCLMAADCGHMIHLKPFGNDHLLENYLLNSSLSNNRLFQYFAAGVPIISYDDPRLDQIHKEIGCFRVVRTDDFTYSFFAIIDAALENMIDFSELGRKGHSAFINKYHFENQIQAINKYLK